MSDPHVDHDPLHDAPDAEKDRQEPVRPEAAFTRDQVQEVGNVFTRVRHPD